MSEKRTQMLARSAKKESELPRLSRESEEALDGLLGATLAYAFRGPDYEEPREKMLEAIAKAWQRVADLEAKPA